MTARDPMHEYVPGVPCWVETFQLDPGRARAFYSELFGWVFTDAEPSSRAREQAHHVIAQKDGLDVAGITWGRGDDATRGPEWTTYVSVASVEESVERARAAGAVDAQTVTTPGGGDAIRVQDAAGATIGLSAGPRAQLVNESCAWVLSVLYARDIDAAKDFYASTFGWTYDSVARPGGELVLCRLPGYFGGWPDQPAPRDTVAVMLTDGQSPSEEKTSEWLPEFWVDDLAAARTTVLRLGGSVLGDPYERPGFLPSLLVADGQGARFSLGVE